MIVVDSSGWLEYLADGPNAATFAMAFKDLSRIVVPTLALLEVAKCVARQRTPAEALRAVASMQQCRVVELTAPLAMSAARIGLELRLPLADSVMLATARAYDAALWTQDSDFDGIPGVRYVRAKKGTS